MRAARASKAPPATPGCQARQASSVRARMLDRSKRAGRNASLGGDAPRADDEPSWRPVDDRVGDARRIDRDEIGDRAGADLPMRAPERLVRLAGDERESLLELAVRKHLVTLGADRGAIEQVAVAERRPAVANVVGAGEHGHPALAERLDRRYGRLRRA